MADHTPTRLAEKPEKPYPDFPLFPHAARQWAKKINGKMKYFGPWEDADGALAKYQAERDDLYAGRKPRPKVEGVMVRAVVNAFLTAKTRAVNAGELTPRSFADYYATCERIIGALGADRAVMDLRADDFAEYRERVATPIAGTQRVSGKPRLCNFGPVALSNEVQRVRCVFKFAFDTDMIVAPMKFGPEFKKPSAKTRRVERAERGAKWLDAVEIKALLAGASTQVKAMILLGVNCGWGNQDVADLETKHLDLDAGVADFPRGKTGIERRAILWPETIKAVREALADRPTNKNEGDAGAVFITKYGWRWKRAEIVGDAMAGERVKRKETDSVGLEFGKLLRAVTVKRGDKSEAIKRPGVNFYTLRHVFQTIGEETGDGAAVKRIMGHGDDDMAAQYREWERDRANGDMRLHRVVNHVHTWLWPKAVTNQNK
jgi:integrase